MRSRTKLVQILFLVVTFVFLAIWSWRKGGDILIDFGLQLYLPWQLALGKLLYRDVAYLPGGPFSQYFNATLFKLFGTSLTTLLLANLAITALMISLLFRFFEKISNTFCATAVCFTVLSVFAFSELVPGGNYNYLCPYSHETFHGLALSVVVVFLFSRWILQQSIASLFIAGFCIGLIFLTKPEIFLAISITTILAWVIYSLQNKEKTSLLKPLACFVIAASIPLAIAFLCFRQFQSTQESLRAVAWAWIPLLTTNATNNKYYVWCMGLDHPLGNMLIALAQFVSVCIALVLCAWCSRSGSRNLRHNVLSGIILAILVGAVWRNNWLEGGRVLFFLTPAISLFLIWHWWKSREQNRLLIPAIIWSVFATTMLAKLGFFSKIWHYGTFLAMPATVLSVYFVFGFLPDYLSKWNVRPKIFLSIFSILLLTLSTKLFFISNETYSVKTSVAGQGPDKLFFYEKKFDPVGSFMEETLQWIEKNSSTDATLAVLPQGVMLNYLSRRTNPTPYTSFILPEWQTFGEEKILASYTKHRPDFIALTYLDSASGFEYGAGNFGESNRWGLKTMQWIKQNYSVVHSIRNSRWRFGIDILQLNAGNRVSNTQP